MAYSVKLHLLDADGNQVGGDVDLDLELRGGELVAVNPVEVPIPRERFVAWEVWSEDRGRLAGGDIT